MGLLGAPVAIAIDAVSYVVGYWQLVAVLGGAALTLFDQGPTLLSIAGVFAMSAAIVALSPVRRVRSA